MEEKIITVTGTVFSDSQKIGEARTQEDAIATINSPAAHAMRNVQINK